MPKKKHNRFGNENITEKFIQGKLILCCSADVYIYSVQKFISYLQNQYILAPREKCIMFGLNRWGKKVENKNKWNKLQSYLFYFVAANHLPSTRSHFLILLRILLLTPPFNTYRYPLSLDRYSWKIHQTEHISSEHLFLWLKLNGYVAFFKFSSFNVRQCKPTDALRQVNVKQVPLYTDISTFYVCALFSMFHFIAFGNIHHVELVVFICNVSGTKPFTLLPLQSNRFLIFFSISQNRSGIFSIEVFIKKRVRPHTCTVIRHSSTFNDAKDLYVESIDVQLSISSTFQRISSERWISQWFLGFCRARHIFSFTIFRFIVIVAYFGFYFGSK